MNAPDHAAASGPESGFALLDALIALAIIGVVLGSFVAVVHSTILTRRHTADIRRAVLLAQSRLAAAEAGDTRIAHGYQPPYDWRMTTSAFAGDGGLAPAGALPLEQVNSVVGDGRGHPLVRVSTLRLDVR